MSGHADLEASLVGEPDAVQVLCGHLRGSADQVRAAAERMASIAAAGNVWEGPVAAGLMEHLADLHRRLATVADELTDAAAALGAWQHELHDRQHRMAMLREEIVAVTSAGVVEQEGNAGQTELEHLRRQVATLVEEHQAGAAAASHRLRRLTGGAEPLAGLRVSSWVAEAEALVNRLDEGVGAWAAAEGGSLSEVVSAISGGTAAGVTIGGAVGAGAPDLDRAFLAMVTALAATTPASHRLVAAARRARTPVPLESLPRASFAPAPRRTGEATS